MRKITATIFITVLFVMVSLTVFAESRVIPHEGNILFPESDVYSVSVNGTKVPVRAEIVDDYPWNTATFSV